MRNRKAALRIGQFETLSLFPWHTVGQTEEGKMADKEVGCDDEETWGVNVKVGQSWVRIRMRGNQW